MLSIRPDVVVSFPVRNLHSTLDPGDSWVEYRLDYLSDQDLNLFRCRGKSEKTILTIRDSAEGGNYDGTLEKKISVYRRLKCGWIDVEFSHLDSYLENPVSGRRVIFSVHDFSGEISPEEIEEMISSITIKNAILKVAMKIGNPEDFLDLAMNNREALLLIDFNSTLNRILFSVLSGTFLYAAYNEPIAPNQPTLLQAQKALNAIYGKF
ncbi:MAG: type I 3-dehydroquinate dehydratase [Candidatus Thermoplasmatota archaeon]|nr:type I 3-dehydroquinate dehydratase [Candidatus Thermoplasmatota archaeon]